MKAHNSTRSNKPSNGSECECRLPHLNTRLIYAGGFYPLGDVCPYTGQLIMYAADKAIHPGTLHYSPGKNDVDYSRLRGGAVMPCKGKKGKKMGGKK